MRRKRKPSKLSGPIRKKPDQEQHRGIPYDGRASQRRERAHLSRFIDEEIE